MGKQFECFFVGEQDAPPVLEPEFVNKTKSALLVGVRQERLPGPLLSFESGQPCSDRDTAVTDRNAVALL